MTSTRVDLDTEGIDHRLRVLPTKGDDLIQLAATNIVARAKASMVGGGTPHVPSAPGEPPHREFSALAEGVHVHPKEHELERDVGDSVEYGLPLELGAERSNLAARPWLIPAMVKEERPLKQAWGQLIERG